MQQCMRPAGLRGGHGLSSSSSSSSSWSGSSGGCSSSSSSLCAAVACTRTRLRSTVYNDPQVVPPPPPPPPPPAPPQQSRRSVLLYAGGGVAAVAGLAALLRGGGQAGPDGLSAQERESIDALREEAGFRRAYDGHVQLLARDGSPVELRLDAKVPGTVLLRDQNGAVYYITLNNIQQIDLTDDYVVMALFGDGGWEDSMTRLTARDDDGRLVDVVLDADAFRDLISVLE